MYEQAKEIAVFIGPLGTLIVILVFGGQWLKMKVGKNSSAKKTSTDDKYDARWASIAQALQRPPDNSSAILTQILEGQKAHHEWQKATHSAVADALKYLHEDHSDMRRTIDRVDRNLESMRE